MCLSLRRTVDSSLNTIKPFCIKAWYQKSRAQSFCIDFILLFNNKKRKRILESENESCMYSPRILLRNVRTRIYSYINSIPIGLTLPFDFYYPRPLINIKTNIESNVHTRNFALHMNFKTSYHLGNFCFFRVSKIIFKYNYDFMMISK